MATFPVYDVVDVCGRKRYYDHTPMNVTSSPTTNSFFGMFVALTSFSKSAFLFTIESCFGRASRVLIEGSNRMEQSSIALCRAAQRSGDRA